MGYVADIVIVVLLLLAAFLGFRKGLANKKWWLMDLLLIVALGVLFGEKIKAIVCNTVLDEKLLDVLGPVINKVDETGEKAAKLVDLIMTIIAWLGIAIVVWIGMAILHVIMKKLAELRFFHFIDGLLGAAYSAVLLAGVLVLVGALVGTFEGYEQVANIIEVCKEGRLVKYVLGENPLQEFCNKSLPLGTWIQNLLGK